MSLGEGRDQSIHVLTTTGTEKRDPKMIRSTNEKNKKKRGEGEKPLPRFRGKKEDRRPMPT